MYFNEDMTPYEAQTTLFRLAPGMTGKELEELKAEFAEVSKIILKKDNERNAHRMTEP